MTQTPIPRVSRVVADPQSVEAAIESRMSVRDFLPDPVPRKTLEHILSVARRSASGTNSQPWKVYVLQGEKRDQLVRETCAAHDIVYADPTTAANYHEEGDYYPSKWVSPYLDRRRENGWGLYGLLGIAKGEKERMHAQHQRNFQLFGAPVALMFTVDKVMGRGSLVDYGMFLQSIMLAARAQGLHTCPQAAWLSYAKIVLPLVGAAEGEMLVCGMAVGHANETAPVNTYYTPREPVDTFTRWVE